MSKDLLYLLEDSFDTKTAIKTGMENLRVTDRTVMNYIKELMKSGLITKAKKGFYEKVGSPVKPRVYPKIIDNLLRKKSRSTPPLS